MSDYMIDLCDALESMTGIDFDTIHQTILDAGNRFPLSGLPDLRSKRDMRKLAKWLVVRLACF